MCWVSKACSIVIFIFVCCSGFQAAHAGAPPPPAAFGNMISTAVWQSEYDFVVKLSIRKGGRTYRCTGIAWKTMVLTSAHCGQNSDGSFVAPSAISAITAHGSRSISAMHVHPKYTSDRADYMILTMTRAVINNQPIAFKATDNTIGTQLMLAGMGVTAHDDANAKYPTRPVLTGFMSTATCHWDEFVNCIGSGPTSQQSSCGGDSGGPWLQWLEETAVIAGVNSFGYGADGCGNAAKMTGFAPPSAVRDWIEQVAPGHFPWTDTTYVKLATGVCPFDRQVSKEQCLSAAKSVGAAAAKTQLDGGNDSGLGGRPQGCTLHPFGNVEWWGPSDNAACGNFNYNCVCKLTPSQQADSFFVKLTTGWCPADRQVGKEACPAAAKKVGASAPKGKIGGNDSGMRGRPQGCTLHHGGNVEWWGPSDNAPCGNLNYDCVCKRPQSRRLAHDEQSRQTNSSVILV